MTTNTTCPTIDALRRLAVGLVEVGEVRHLEEHVQECSLCVRSLRGLPDNDPLVEALRTIGPSEPTPLVNLLVPLLKRLKLETAATGSWEPEEPKSCDAPPRPALLAPPQQPGEIGRLGPYSIREVLGAGGMGMVLRGFDPQLSREIAIKVVRPDLLARSGMIERFLQEAQAIARVEHDNIVVIHSVEKHDGVPCIVMPLLRGESLDKRLRAPAERLAPAEVLRIARETAAGLAAAHERGLIHRDIKPANLWLESPRDRVKILDFGLACARSDDADLTQAISGTPGYLSPEQAQGLPVDARSDLFSLGCVLYRMATGQLPFPDARTFTAIVKVALDRPKPALEVNPKLPGPLANLIETLLAKEPENRPASAAAVVETITAIEADASQRRHRITRRRWFAAVASAAAVSGVAVWGMKAETPPPAEAKPVKVTILSDAQATKIVLSNEGREQVVELTGQNALELLPGDYDVRTSTEMPGLVIEPSKIIVLPDEPQTVKLGLVGEIARHGTHGQDVTGIAVLAEKNGLAVLSAGLDRSIVRWEPASKNAPIFANTASPVRCFAATSAGALAASAGGNKQPPLELAVQRWHPQTLQPVGETLKGHTRLITAMAIVADGKHLLTASTNEVFFWDLATGTSRAFDPADLAGVHAVALSANQKWALTGDEDGLLILWNVATGKPLRQMTLAHKGAIRCTAFLPNGFASAGDDGVIRLWDQATFKARELTGHAKPVLAITVSPDGTRLLSGGADGTIRLWSIVEGRLLYTLKTTRAVNAVAFSPDGRRAASGGADRMVRLWQLPY